MRPPSRGPARPALPRRSPAKSAVQRASDGSSVPAESRPRSMKSRSEVGRKEHAGGGRGAKFPAEAVRRVKAANSSAIPNGRCWSSGAMALSFNIIKVQGQRACNLDQPYIASQPRFSASLDRRTLRPSHRKLRHRVDEFIEVIAGIVLGHGRVTPGFWRVPRQYRLESPRVHCENASVLHCGRKVIFSCSPGSTSDGSAPAVAIGPNWTSLAGACNAVHCAYPSTHLLWHALAFGLGEH